LVRHTRAAIGICKELLVIKGPDFSKYSGEELKKKEKRWSRQKDISLITLLAHDMCKLGEPGTKSKFTAKKHDEIMAQYILDNFTGIINDKELNMIADGIRSHMGQWGKCPPQNSFTKFIHECDYLASRKCLEFNFEAKIEDR